MNAQCKTTAAGPRRGDAVAMASSLFDTLPVEIVEETLRRGDSFDWVALRFVCRLWGTILCPG